MVGLKLCCWNLMCLILCSVFCMGLSRCSLYLVGIMLDLLCISSGLLVMLCRCCSVVLIVGCDWFSLMVVCVMLCFINKVCKMCKRYVLIVLCC